MEIGHLPDVVSVWDWQHPIPQTSFPCHFAYAFVMWQTKQSKGKKIKRKNWRNVKLDTTWFQDGDDERMKRLIFVHKMIIRVFFFVCSFSTKMMMYPYLIVDTITLIRIQAPTSVWVVGDFIFCFVLYSSTILIYMQ